MKVNFEGREVEVTSCEKQEEREKALEYLHGIWREHGEKAAILIAADWMADMRVRIHAGYVAYVEAQADILELQNKIRQYQAELSRRG